MDDWLNNWRKTAYKLKKKKVKPITDFPKILVSADYFVDHIKMRFSTNRLVIFWMQKPLKKKQTAKVFEWMANIWSKNYIKWNRQKQQMKSKTNVQFRIWMKTKRFSQRFCFVRKIFTSKYSEFGEAPESFSVISSVALDALTRRCSKSYWTKCYERSQINSKNDATNITTEGGYSHSTVV